MNFKCPNKNCEMHLNPKGKFYTKNGKYKTKDTEEEIQKYKCKVCKKDFSLNTFSPTYGQSKSSVNYDIIDLLFKSYSERGIAEELGITKVTVEKKLKLLGEMAKSVYDRTTAFDSVNPIVVEKFETYEHSKSNRVYVEFIICSQTSKIINFLISYNHLDTLSENYPNRGDLVCHYNRQIQSEMLRLKPNTTNGPKSIDSLKRLLYLFISRVNGYGIY